MKVTFLERLSIVGKEGSLGSIASDEWFGVKHSLLEREMEDLSTSSLHLSIIQSN